MFFYTCMSLCYIFSWLHAKFLKGCNLSESFWVQGPRGVFSQVYPSHLRFRGPELSSSSCDLVGFLKFSCLFLRICCGYSCQANTAAVVAPRAFMQSEDALSIIMQLYCICSRNELSSQVWGLACAAIPGLKRLVFFVQRPYKN